MHGGGAIHGCLGKGIIFFNSVATDKFRRVNNTLSPTTHTLMLIQATLIRLSKSTHTQKVMLEKGRVSGGGCEWVKPMWDENDKIYFKAICNYQPKQQNSELWWLKQSNSESGYQRERESRDWGWGRDTKNNDNVVETSRCSWMSDRRIQLTYAGHREVTTRQMILRCLDM